MGDGILGDIYERLEAGEQLEGKYRFFYIEDDKLFYFNPRVLQYPIHILEEANKDEIIRHAFETVTDLIGKGIVSAYKYLRQFYNVKREDVARVVRSNVDYGLQTRS